MNREITIGKFTLDSLTTGMYSDSKMVYREYVQNSVDAIDQAIKNKILPNRKAGKIDIYIDKNKKVVSIKDNGIGVSSENAYNILCDIGNSGKTYEENRGFRGIGRLGGLSYCDNLIFETSFKGENKKTIIRWDAKQLKELILPGNNNESDLKTVLDNIIYMEIEEEEVNKHYFKVTLCNIKGESKLLDINEVTDYLQQVAPIPFNTPSFPFYSDSVEGIKAKIKELDLEIEEYKIFINDNPAYLEKPYKSDFSANGKIDNIRKVKCFTERDIQGNLLYWGWYAISNFKGTVDDEKLRGIRMRKGNILIGDFRTFEQFFTKSNTRYNGWFIGEIHFHGQKLIPNGRRDDFETNDEYLYVKKLITRYAKEVFNSIVRDSSQVNATMNNIIKNIKKIDENKKKMESNLIDKKKKEEIKIENKKIINVVENDGKKLKKFKSTIKEHGIDRDESIEPILALIGSNFDSNKDELNNINLEERNTDIETNPKNNINKVFNGNDIYALLEKVLSSYARNERKLVMRIINVIEMEVKKENELNSLLKKVVEELSIGKKK